MSSFNRKDIQYLRSKGGWSVPNFAKLLGVAQNSVYRWERAPKEVAPGPLPTLPIEPMQDSILMILDQIPLTIAQAKEIELALMLDGPLRGLYVILDLYYGRAQQPKRTKNKAQAQAEVDTASAPAGGRHVLPVHDEDLVAGEDDDG